MNKLAVNNVLECVTKEGLPFSEYSFHAHPCYAHFSRLNMSFDKDGLYKYIACRHLPSKQPRLSSMFG